MRNFDLELSNFDCGSSGISGDMTEVEVGDYLLRSDVQQMCQQIKRDLNYKDAFDRISALFEMEGL
jgi:hypothetical protein